DLLVQGDVMRGGGNYPAAISAYQSLIDQAGPSPSGQDMPLKRAALYRLAQTYALDYNYAASADTWQKYFDVAGEDPRRVLALLQQANALQNNKNYAAAFLAFQAYRQAAPADDLLAPYVALTLAQGYRDAGQLALSVQEFKNVLAAPGLTNAMRALSAQQLAQVHSRTGDDAGAVLTYDAALQYAETSNTRSQLDLAAARALKELGRTDEAIVRLRRILANWTDGDAAPQAVEMLNTLAPKDFNYYYAGLTYYYTKQYGTANFWFQRYLKEQGTSDLAYYYSATSYEFASQQDVAIRQWTALIQNYPSSSKVTEARFERADDYHRLGQDAEAINQYQQLAADFPTSHWAEDGLFALARIYEDQKNWADAARQYEKTQAINPRGARAAEALAQAGLDRYRANDFNGARAVLERLDATYPGSVWKAEGLFWLAKTLQRQGKDAEAKSRFAQAFQAKPDDYYGMHALDKAQSTVPSGAERQSNFSVPTSFSGDVRVMEHWLRKWIQLPLLEDPQPLHRPVLLSQLKPVFADDLRLARGKLLIEVGMIKEGKAELKDISDKYKDDPLVQYQLSYVLRELGAWDVLIRAGYRIFYAAPEDDLNLTPEYEQRLVYPAPYAQIIVQEAQRNGIDPLLFYALTWQESQFDPTVTSAVGARGLGQVMPGTGQQIANALKLPNFQVADLYKPYVSVKFGAYYFGRQYNSFDQDYMMALAGYNGGPGNAAIWKAPDVDIAVENIRFQETRTYVRRIYQHYWYYRHLYGGEQF
ncbi:MAG: tetratricopeptide repeat protein, partial [Chloroflexi bacterium]